MNIKRKCLQKEASCVFTALIIFLFAAQCFASPVTHRQANIAGVSAHVVTVDLSSPEALPTVQVAVGFPSSAENFSSFLKRSKPLLAVTGTYFCKRTLKPVGDIVVEGQEMNFGGMGTAMCVTGDNGLAFIDVEWGRHMDYTHCKTVLAAGPRLVRDGEVWVYPKEQGFSDPHVLGNANRIGVGITQNNKLIIAVVRASISLEKMGNVMKQLGSVHAMGLDAGASIALYVNGKTYVSPSRKLVNLLVIPGSAVSAVMPSSETLTETAETETEEETPQKKKAKQKKTTPIKEAKKGKKKTVIPTVVTSEAAPEQKAWTAYKNAEKLMAQGKVDKAIENLKDAVYFSPGNASFAKALAQACEKSSRVDEAAAAYTLTGKIYMNKEMVGEAEAQFLKAVALSPKNIEAHKALAGAYKALGRNAEAAQELKLVESLSVESVTLASFEETTEILEEKTAVETPPETTEETQEEGLSLEEQEQKEIKFHEEALKKNQEEEAKLKEVQQKYPTNFAGDYQEGTYTENRFKFKLNLPEGWAYEELQDAAALKMRDMENPFFATLQIIPLTKEISPRDFEEKFVAGMYKKKAVDRDRALGGETAYEVVYDEMINDRVWGSRYVYVRRDNLMLILSMTTYAERYEDASLSFREIIDGLEFLP